MDSTRIDEISIIENAEISVIQNVENDKKFKSPKKVTAIESKENSPKTRQRNTRRAALKVKQILQQSDDLTDDETSTETEDEDPDWRGDGSDSESDKKSAKSSRSQQRSKKKTTLKTSRTAKRNNVKGSNEKLVYLDLSSNEVVEVDETYKHNVSGLFNGAIHLYD